jgi:hypothetical protein
MLLVIAYCVVENAMFKLNTAVPGQVFAKLLCTSLISSSPHPNIYWIAPHGIKIADSLPDARYYFIIVHTTQVLGQGQGH